MKRLLTLIAAALLALSLAACTKDAASDPTAPSTTPTTPSQNPSQPSIPSVPDGSMPPATTPEGETVPNVPMDFEEAANQMGTNVNTYFNSDSDSDCVENLAISGEDVLYQSISAIEFDADGATYTYTVNANHMGKLSAGSGKSQNIHFTAAYLTLTFPEENAEQTKQLMLDSLDNAPLNDEGKDSLRQLIGGAKIYAAAGSELWDMFVDVPEEAKIVIENGTFYFFSGGDGDFNELHHDYIRDDQDRELKHTAYYFDEEGTKWIESIDEYEYSENSTRHTQTYYYSYSTQINSYYVNISTYDGEVTSFKNIELREYYPDGTPMSEFYLDENGNSVKYEYTEEGIKVYEEYTDAEGTYVQATYQGDGTLSIRFTRKTDGTETEETYTPDGTLSYKYVRRNDLMVEEYTTYPNGNPQYHTYYYESGREYLREDYYESGELDSIYEYYDNEESSLKHSEYYMGKFIYQITNYYPNGAQQNLTQYFHRSPTDTEDRIKEYTENYENGETAKYREYDGEGNLIDSREYFENGDWKYGYIVMEDGTVDESTYYDNGRMKKSVTIHPDGQQYIHEWHEDGSEKYDFRDFGNGSTMEIVYDENGMMSKWTDTYDDGSWSCTEYFGFYENGQAKQTKGTGSDGYVYIYDYYENGQYSRSYTKNPDGSAQSIYFDEDGNFLRMETE